MFGFFKKKEYPVEQVDQRYKEIAMIITKVLERDPAILALPNIGEHIARDSLRNLTEQQLLEGSVFAMAFWSIACTANGAFKDNDLDAAKALAQVCMPLAGLIKNSNPRDYSKIERSFIVTGMGFLREIELAGS